MTIAIEEKLNYNDSIILKGLSEVMRDNRTKRIALGGILGALALVIMCLGGIIPVATYVCPMLCAIVQFIVLQSCGKRLAWTWYVVVALLSMLLGPDKEAAGVFVFLGYYPILKPLFERSRLAWLWKLLLFNTAIGILYGVMLYLLGLQQVVADAQELGMIGLVVMLLLGNLVFVLLDRVLTMLHGKLKRK